MDERKRHALPPYREIADGSLSLRAPIGGGRYVDRPEAVRFLPGAAHFFRLKSIATTLEPSSGGDAGGSPSFSAVSLSSRSSSASCPRSEERRVGKEWVSTCRSRGVRYI